MVKQGPPRDRIEAILAVSGGADSVYLLDHYRKKFRRLLVAHVNHGARGRQSEKDQRFLEGLCRDWGLPLEVGRAKPEGILFPLAGKGGRVLPRFEEKARAVRYTFLKEMKRKHRAEKILVAHTADDQVETVLMRILKGAGIAGLKGIPRTTEDGIERPLLDTWREEILTYLKKHKIPYRIDQSNLDTRFERNWIRHVLIPFLEKRYGKAVKKRIFALGERFRELDVYIDENAHKWLKRYNIYTEKKGLKEYPSKDSARFPRKAYAGLPSLLRMRILQILCFERIGTSTNERILYSMDRVIVSGGPSAQLNIGKGASLRCRYGEAFLSPPGKKAKSGAGESRSGRPGKGEKRKGRKELKTGKTGKKKGAVEPILQMDGPGTYRWNRRGREGGGVEDGSPVSFSWEERGKTAPGRIRKMAQGERQAVFDVELIRLPLSVRPLRTGDRIRPFGLDGEKKVKEILIDRKIPREERWGRSVICDAEGMILWIPGVLRSAHAPVTPRTSRTILLRTDIGGKPLS
jgi:tRNA(Ile)-lysidine synthase